MSLQVSRLDHKVFLNHGGRWPDSTYRFYKDDKKALGMWKLSCGL